MTKENEVDKYLLSECDPKVIQYVESLQKHFEIAKKWWDQAEKKYEKLLEEKEAKLNKAVEVIKELAPYFKLMKKKEMIKDFLKEVEK